MSTSDELTEKTLEEIRTETFDRIDEVQEEYAAKGWLPRLLNLKKGVIRGILELCNWGLYQLYQFLTLVLRQAFPSTATGLWLDIHCAQVEVYRKAATKAAGTVYFYRTESEGNVPIPAGRIVRTLPDGAGNIYRFITTEDAVLLDGETEVAAAIEAEEYGSASNVTAGQICEISTTIDGVDGVENRADWLDSEGSDEEGDDSLRQRYVLKWQENNGCTKYAYESWALSVTGVVSARIIDQHPRGQGTVDVVITGSAGIPTQALIDAVDAVVDEKKPINDDTLVKGPTPVNVDIDVQLELVSGNEDDIADEAEDRLRALFDTSADIEGVTMLAVGEDLTTDRLIATVMAVAGVKKSNWTSPPADIQIDEDELAVLQSINISTVLATEE